MPCGQNEGNATEQNYILKHIMTQGLSIAFGMEENFMRVFFSYMSEGFK